MSKALDAEYLLFLLLGLLPLFVSFPVLPRTHWFLFVLLVLFLLRLFFRWTFF